MVGRAKASGATGGQGTNLPAALLQLLMNEVQVDRSTVLRRLGISPPLLDALLDDLVRRGWLAVSAPATVDTVASGAFPPPTRARAVRPAVPAACRTCPLAARSFLVDRVGDLPAARRYLLTPAGRRHLQAFLQALQKSPS